MSLLTETLLYMLLSIIYVVIVDHLLYKYDVRDYQVFGDKQRFTFMLTMLSLLYLLYTIIYNNTILPIMILTICVSVLWTYFFVMDIDLKFYSTIEKIILLSITLIAFLAIYFSIEYILLLGLQKFVRIDLCDNSNACENCYGSCCNNDESIYVTTNMTEMEVNRIIQQHVYRYDDDDDYGYDDMKQDIINIFGGETPTSKIFTVCSINIHDP